MAKTLTVRIEESAYKLIAEAAAAENRSISNFIETAALKRAAEEISVPHEEMAEIRSDKSLLKRLKAGHRDAAARRGRFV
jgi:uncharacterized protein (DUF1778 family)